jgi:hypothetical protein
MMRRQAWCSTSGRDPDWLERTAAKASGTTQGGNDQGTGGSSNGSPAEAALCCASTERAAVAALSPGAVRAGSAGSRATPKR